MWIIQKLLDYLSFAIQWFWLHYEKYKKEGSIWKVAVLFACSLSGFFLTVGSFAWFMYYLITYHTEILIGFGLLIWLYAYVKSVMDKKAEERLAQETEHVARLIVEEDEQEEQARKSRRLVCNVIYQTLREMATDISGKPPRLSSEIEIFGMPYFIRDNLIFYQFRLAKESLTQYPPEDLEEYKKMLQAAISRKIQSGDFPTLGMDVYPYGNGVYDAVIVDSFEDVGNEFIIQAVLYSPVYAEYLIQKQNNQQMLIADNTSVPDATWRDKK